MDLFLKFYREELKQLSQFTHDEEEKKLLHPFAFSMARIRNRLHDSETALSHRLVQQCWLPIGRYIPALGLICFHGSGHDCLPQGFLLKRSNMRQDCYFRTVYSMRLSPFIIDGVHFSSQKESGCLAVQMSLNKNTVHRQRQWTNILFYIHMEFEAACLLYALLFNAVSKIGIVIDNQEEMILHTSIISAPYLNLDTSLFFDFKYTLPPLQLLYEFFIFPEKFLFFELDLSCISKKNISIKKNMLIHIYFNQRADRVTASLSSGSLQLNCTPVINLFEHPSNYIHSTLKCERYNLSPQYATEPLCVYHLKSLYEIDAHGKKHKVAEFDGDIVDTGRQWEIEDTRLYQSVNRRNSNKLSLIRCTHDQCDQSRYLQAILLCSNLSAACLDAEMAWKIPDEALHVLHSIDTLKEISAPYQIPLSHDAWKIAQCLLEWTRSLLHSPNKLYILKEIMMLMPVKHENKRKLLLSSIQAFDITANDIIGMPNHANHYTKVLTFTLVLDTKKIEWVEFYLFWQVLKSVLALTYSLYLPLKFCLHQLPQEKTLCSMVYKI
jgi:type VI protein secretion system component VasA